MLNPLNGRVGPDECLDFAWEAGEGGECARLSLWGESGGWVGMCEEASSIF